MRSFSRAGCFLLLLLVSACGSGPDVSGSADEAAGEAVFLTEGMASYYGARHQGLLTASGERFDKNALTAAHKTLPFGTRVKVTNLQNQRAVMVTINDRGPYVRSRVIDLSERAAQELGMLRAGVAPVRLERLQ